MQASTVIGIPTVPRRNGTDYLTRTLASLLEELPLDPTDVLFRRVKVIVMNNRPGNHSAWSKVALAHRLLLYIISATPPPLLTQPPPFAWLFRQCA